MNVHGTMINGDGRKNGHRAVNIAALSEPDLGDIAPGTVAQAAPEWSVAVVEPTEEEALREAVDTPAVDSQPDDDAQDDDRLWKPPIETKPLLPAWWTSEHRWEIVRWHANYRAREAARFVLFMGSLYWLRAAMRTPRGISRSVTETWRWVFDHESLPIRRQLRDGTTRHEAITYLAVSRQRNERVQRRGGWVLACLLVLAGYLGYTHWWGPWWLKAVTAVVALVVFGKVGSDPADPIIDRGRITPRVRKLDPGTIQRAFAAAGLADDKHPVTLPLHPYRDGPGWGALIDLDFKYTAEKAMKRRVEIAAGLDFDETQVWLDRVRGTAGSARRLKLWIADEDPFEKSAGPWPLLRAGIVDIFKTFPFGSDQRGRMVAMSMMYTSLLIGSVPRVGKTAAGRLTAIACALDPIVELHIYDGKGGSDWRAFEKVAHRCGFGARTETVEALLADLQDLQRRMNERYDQIAKLGPDLCPDSQVTRDLAERRGLKLWPVGIWIDEFQRFCKHPEHGDAIVDVLIDLAKIGPAVGIFLCLMTQKPDGDSIPTTLRDVLGTRFALFVKSWQSSECVLGAGAKAEGCDASKFRRSDKGVGWLIGADDTGAVDDASIVRTYYVRTEQVPAVLDRARSVRLAAGLLTGLAAGTIEPLKVEDRSAVLVDVLSVWPDGADKVANARLASLLADYSPRYEGWQSKDVTSALKYWGVRKRQVNRRTGERDDRANLQGTARADVENALQEASGGAGK